MAEQEGTQKKASHLPKESEEKTTGKAPGKASPSAAEEAREQREIRREAREVENKVRDSELSEKEAQGSVYGRAAVEQERRARLDKELKGAEKSRDLGEGDATVPSERIPGPDPTPEPEPVEGSTTVGSPAPAQRTYTVVSGDTLSHIALNFYGDASQWRKIYEANRDKISNPDLIYPGQVFLIP
jgi:nucleoid-associated protein YgaU